MLKGMNESFSKNFATKDELTPIKEKQAIHDTIIARIAWGSFIGIITIA